MRINGKTAAAALGMGRWAVELSAIAEYSGLDNAMQHLAMFKMAQLVSYTLFFDPGSAPYALMMLLYHPQRLADNAEKMWTVAGVQVGQDTASGVEHTLGL